MTTSHFDLFPYFWLTMVAIIGVTNVAWGIHDLRAGSARMGWMSNRVERSEEPFEFWIAVDSKLLAGVAACFMFYFGLDMFRW